MYHIGICDDGINVCSDLEEMILDYARRKNIDVKVYIWYSGESCRDYLLQKDSIDILFLDIELMKMNGIALAHFLRNDMDNMGVQIVYISSKASYAQQLFKTQPLDFLVKPILQNQIDEVLSTAIRIIGKNKMKFEYQSGKEYYSVESEKILYFYSEGRKINIVTSYGTKTFYGKLTDIFERLPDTFIRIHHSYIVNTNYILCYTYETVELIDKTKLPISKSYRKQIRERLLQER